MYGLLIDPGASRGLIGTDTLREIIMYVLRPYFGTHHHKHLHWTSSNNQFTGISDKTEHSIGMVTFDIGLLGIKDASFSCDVIGGNASWCPGLVPLRSLSSWGCILACGYYNNGDGILGLRDHSKQLQAQRLLLTDSGHYLLPIHHFGNVKNDQMTKAISHQEQQLSHAASQGQLIGDDKHMTLHTVAEEPQSNAESSLVLPVFQ